MIRNNQRRTPGRKISAIWLQWSHPAQRLAVIILAVGVTLGTGWWLNGLASISKWQIQASPEIKRQLQAELQAMESLDFVHSQPDRLKSVLLERIPDIATITIQRRLPDTLLIAAEPRQRLALWQNGEGAIYLVDEKGQPFRLRHANESTNLPILRVSKEKLIESTELMLQIKQQWPEWYTATSEMFDEQTGWKINLSHQQQWRIPFGLRARHDIEAVTELLKSKRWSQRYWRINTRLGDRWFFRPAEKGGLV
ncbi:MAG: hypothetical protein CO186_12080 [Zetaproteobacteria bacterium CG_4_9_14_3_um_filter_49_83]|nr:MAG: hypothetical protein AUJ56_10485 [Zetaproteobacteria bacterium CG1_02_49_23]PIQ34448.1 MAG: hypothetical protein COW62_01940 [Zetaproteobacteria bacterium CG17_big_fil_post_rev_8_21_14_2_50_50_13]PIV29057.1 MAG: hypothetical protein COS35_14090 [Zetaproteobacteria bacterium CG02_land_8_20_14_3_00_50_9]PIY56431.1 MAG: hypothetical protein COZ00_04440 [Zetaproteobacteria bacterium CG_4_10_14_0_8_um_filter_49_80]PJA34070.1 MAG: hypothetical protein CO186_12080 [Zetaproteobacteria bacterium